MTRVISFSSGKGGVGKTSLVANLGMLWSRTGRKTLMVDADWSLGKLGITLGLRPRWTIGDVLEGQVGLEGAIAKVNEKLSLLASPSGVIGFEELSDNDRNQLFFEMECLSEKFDLILFDHASGVNWNVLQFAAAAHQHVIVTTTEPTSYTDAYAIMKILSKRFGVREFLLVVTMSGDSIKAQKIIDKFADVARGQLQIRLSILDVFPWDPRLGEAVRQQRPFVQMYPHTELTARLERLRVNISERGAVPHHGLNFFYKNQPNHFTVG